MAGTDLCDSTTTTISGLLLLLGEGIPDPGDLFVSGGSMFDKVSNDITSLVPGGNWLGSAAEAYSAQNLAQSLRTMFRRSERDLPCPATHSPGRPGS